MVLGPQPPTYRFWGNVFGCVDAWMGHPPALPPCCHGKNLERSGLRLVALRMFRTPGCFALQEGSQSRLGGGLIRLQGCFALLQAEALRRSLGWPRRASPH